MKPLVILGRYIRVSMVKFSPGLLAKTALKSPLIAKYSKSPASVPIISPYLRIQYDVKL